ncbi:RNA-binding protein [Candidatus Dojkabacteria bacterium HGW-Dojkabacteria-1]|uniref:RNA-binding protein KhpA n=1 Tax=Candidatus Dojkabacteria bacterium HGW-Dojkabacteria-1 TaxID=2013761 RepID=A0A2N2F423_9BACT|nr:MAG: RNA-binding protein [Candidatus Dojkabacteria bacterium HGW-Dojkabacteria-1]
MKELLVHIIKSIVNYPDDVSVEERDSVDFPGLTILTIDVNESDKGVIIGRKGRTINSIRDIVTISAIRNNKRVRVLLKDDRGEHHSEDEDMLRDEI